VAKRFTVSARIVAEDKASATVGKVESRFKRLGTSIKANALKITAALAGIAIAFRAIESSAEEIGQRSALEANLARQGIAIDKFLGNLKDLSDGQIAAADLVLASNRALKLGIQATDLPALLTTAAQAAVDLGISTTQAFNDITTGVGRASPLILDNLGIVIDANRVYGDYAASIGTTVEALTKQQKTIALTSAVIATSGDETKKFSERQAELTRSINKGRAAFDNFKSTTGQLLGALVQMTAGGLTGAIVAMSLFVEVSIKAARAQIALVRLIPGLGNAFEGVSKSLKAADDDIDAFQKRTAKLAFDLSKGGISALKFAVGVEDVGNKAGVAAGRIREAGKAAAAVIPEVGALGEAAAAAGDEFDDFALGLASSAAAAREAEASYSRLTLSVNNLRASGLASSIAASKLGQPFRGDFATQAEERRNRAIAPIGGFTTISGGTFSTPIFTSGGRRFTVLPNGRIELID